MRIFDWQRWWPGGWPPSENVILLGLAVAVGLTTGAGVWLFREGIEFFVRFYRDGLAEWLAPLLGAWAIVPILALAGLIVGWMMRRFVGAERHHGVAGIIESTALAGGRLPYRRMPIKAALAAFSIGAGASVGPEDPSVQIGANLGSMFGQRLHLSDERVRLLVAAGAAGGIASAFGAPIAGVFFALEAVLGDFSTGSFGVVVLASVISSVFTKAVEAGGPELGIRAYALGGVQEIPLFILLALLAAPLAALFIRALYWQQDFWHHVPLPLRTALAGVVVGVIAVAFPQVMGTGRETMNALLNAGGGDFTVTLLLLLVPAKLIATVVSLGGGFVGGMFAPSLFVGAALGGAFGRIASIVFGPGLNADPAAFAIAGMAAMMTGVIRAPITAVLLLFELTNDYTLILPIMLVTAVSLIVIERLAPDGIYQHGLARKGIRIARGRDIDLMQTVTVGEALTKDVQTVPAALPLDELPAEFARTHTHGLLVTDPDGRLFGIVTLQDLARARERELAADATVGDICTREVLSITPDEAVSAALHLIGERDVGRLPVVQADDPGKIVGVLRRRDIARAYDMALQRKLERQHRGGQVKLAAYSRAQVVELRIQAGAPSDGSQLRTLNWPAGSVVAAVLRRDRVITPRGDTTLHAGDQLTIVTTGVQEAELARLVSAPENSTLQPGRGDSLRELPLGDEVDDQDWDDHDD